MSSVSRPVVRVLQVLEALEGGRTVSVAELSQRTRIPRSTLYALVRTLRTEGYVIGDIRDGIKLSMKMFVVGSSCIPADLRALCRPVLERAVAFTGETCHLAILDPGDATVVYLDKVDGTRSIRMGSRIGLRNPAYCTGLGKALLGAAPKEFVESYIRDAELKAFTAYTITDSDVLRYELSHVSVTGMAFDREEHEDGVRCVAVPSRSLDGGWCAISIAGPAARLTDDVLEQYGNKLKELVTEIVDGPVTALRAT